MTRAGAVPDPTSGPPLTDSAAQGGDAAPGRALPPVNILLVDDRLENILALEAILGDEDYSLISVSSGREVLRAVLEREFAVILLDVRMPEMDGFETAELLRQRLQTQHTPIIFLTAGDNSTDKVARGYAVGAVDYMAKPFDPDILRAKVAVFVELYLKTQELKALNEALEERVRERTWQIEMANRVLTREVADRRKAEAEVRELNTALEARVKERTAELESANKELQAFSYSVTHDLRAPLRRIEAFSEMLQEEHSSALNEDGKAILGRIAASCDHMEQLIDDVLKLSRIAEEQVKRERVDLSAMASHIIFELRQANPDRQVDVKIAEGLSAQADPRLLRLAVGNLLENAWKFTGKKGNEAAIEVGELTTGGGKIFFIRDNGAGFNPAEKDRLFTPFTRLHKSSDFPGTGIGLAIVQRVIQRHGGTISVESQPDQGTTFFFSL